MYTIQRDEGAGYNQNGQPFAVAIERDGYTVLHLQPGTERNEQPLQMRPAAMRPMQARARRKGDAQQAHRQDAERLRNMLSANMGRIEP